MSVDNANVSEYAKIIGGSLPSCRKKAMQELLCYSMEMN